tara:strand:- start:3945 stop:4205 length:261 start_codon:yes stop_codon:yes gene_type:complete
MQKIINVLAIASSVVSLTVVGVGGYVYLNKDAIINSVTQKALGSLGGFGGGVPDLGGGALKGTVPDMAAPQSPMSEIDPSKSVPAF